MPNHPPTVTTRDVGALDWLTLAECAGELGVAVSQARLWCIRWREGQSGGLRYAHFGAKPEGEAERTNYRVHRDDWESFKRERRREEKREDREVRKWVEAPISYV